MEQKELIITTAKELLIKGLDLPTVSKLSVRDSADAVQDLGERFKTLVQKVSEAAASLER